MVFSRKGFPRKNLCLVFDLDLRYLLTSGTRARHEIEKKIRLGFHPIHRAAAGIIFGSVFSVPSSIGDSTLLHRVQGGV